MLEGIINSNQGRLALRKYFIRRYNLTLKDYTEFGMWEKGVIIISQVTVWSGIIAYLMNGEVLIEPVA